MHITMEHPYVLFLIPVLSALFLITGSKMRTANQKRKYAAIGIRIAVSVLLVLAMCGIGLRKSSDHITTIYLVDVSDSIAGKKGEVEQFVKDGIGGMPSGDKAGVIAFGSDTKVEQFVTDKKLFANIETSPVTTATNLEKAVQSAMALFTDDSAKRLVLITDGKENEGSLQNMSSALVSNQVAVEVHKVESSNEKEVYIDNVTVPEEVNLGDTFQVEVEIESNVKTTAKLTLYSGNTEKAAETVELETGTNHFVFRDTQTESGLKTYRVRIEPLEDTNTVNNEYAAFTNAKQGNSVLLIEGKQGQGKAFTQVLDAANINYHTIVPQTAPNTIIEMNAYKSIITLDVHADDLPKGFKENLESYVKDYAGGFIAIGGENSFALGDYKDTSLETVLPVSMDLEGEKEVPALSMAMVIDHSGSMADGNGVITYLDLAKQAAISALEHLRAIDKIGVVAFDDTYQWAVKMTQAEDTEQIKEKIYSIILGGGTSIYPAVDAAEKELEKSDTKLKHIILLSDGQDGFGDYDDLLGRLKENGITLSTVAVGSGADTTLMSYLAEQGGGRYYYTGIETDLPRIFAQEVYLSAKEYLNQREFTPVITQSSDILENVTSEGLPTMLGYIASTAKSTATVHLMSDTKDPILTTWQYGLGRTAAFNSDGENKWTANYAGWNNYAALWKNIIDWTIAGEEEDGEKFSVTQNGSTASLSYEIEDYNANTKVSAVYTDEEGNTKEIQLDATAPGKYEKNLTFDKTGVYSINIRRKEKGEIVSSKNSAMAMQYSPEYKYQESHEALDEFIESTAGIFIEKPSEIYAQKPPKANESFLLTNLFLILAILCFFYDILYRRLQRNFIAEGIQFFMKKTGMDSMFEKRKERAAEKRAAREKEAIKNETSMPNQKTDDRKAVSGKKSLNMKNKKAVKEKKKEKQVTQQLDTAALLNRKKEREK